MNETTTVNPRDAALALYRAVWERVGATYHPQSRLADWSLWKNRFDDSIATPADAFARIADMLASIGDEYTNLKVPAGLPVATLVVDGKPVVGTPEPPVLLEVAPTLVHTRLLPNGIGYLKVTTFHDKDLSADLERAMKTMPNVDAYIVDLRSNRGGFVHQANAALSLFLDAGIAYNMQKVEMGRGYLDAQCVLDADGFVETSTYATGEVSSAKLARHVNLSQNRPVVLLVDYTTCSAAELFAGMMRDNNRAFIIGERTFGKGIAQNEYTMPLGCTLKITDCHTTMPNGQWLGDCGQTIRNGLHPHVVVPPVQEYDAPVQHAMRWLGGKLGFKWRIPGEPQARTTSGAGLMFAAGAFALALLAGRGLRNGARA